MNQLGASNLLADNVIPFPGRDARARRRRSLAASEFATPGAPDTTPTVLIDPRRAPDGLRVTVRLYDGAPAGSRLVAEETVQIGGARRHQDLAMSGARRGPDAANGPGKLVLDGTLSIYFQPSLASEMVRFRGCATGTGSFDVSMLPGVVTIL